MRLRTVARPLLWFIGTALVAIMVGFSLTASANPSVDPNVPVSINLMEDYGDCAGRHVLVKLSPNRDWAEISCDLDGGLHRRGGTHVTRELRLIVKP
jgi:hypothetical protein